MKIEAPVALRSSPVAVKGPAPSPSSLGRAEAPTGAAIRTFFTGAGLLVGWLMPTVVGKAGLVLAFVAGSYGPIVGLVDAARERQIGVDLLMLLAAFGAAAISQALEGAVLLFLFSLSGTLEAYAMYRTRSSIDSLIRLRPNEALRVREGVEERVAIDDLQVGDIVRVMPGERFAVDGEVLEGETWTDEATLTGESAPQEKQPGSLVFAGTINGPGSILIRMNKAVADTTLERIVRLVQEAQAEQTPTQRFLESWQQPYVLGVLSISMATFAVSWWLHREGAADAFYHAMVMLVAASPCAVVVASPAVLLTAIARAARFGVLFKGGYHLELLGRADIIAFDKTGTITEGRPRVVEVWAAEGTTEGGDQLLRWAASLEQRSEHPLAQAIVDAAAARGLSLTDPVEFENHVGLGVHGRLGEIWFGLGREPLFRSHEVDIPQSVQETADHRRRQGKTVLLAISSQGTAGVMVLEDVIRKESPEVIRALKRLGVRQTIMLTGDHEAVARSVAERVGIDAVHAGLLPDQKLHQLKSLMKDGAVVAMVGDGINDAPALAAAPVGVAMGGAGTDVALEVADVVLMRDDLRALPEAIALSRRARRRVTGNLLFAFAMIAMLICGTFLGLPLWLGVIGHEGSTLLVILNGIRLYWEKSTI